MKINAPRGTEDILPDETVRWQRLEETARSVFRTFNYKEIRTPIFEDTSLFNRGVGDTTDIVSKEMYTFSDKKGRQLTLRPEGTASIVRAFIQHNLAAKKPLWKLYYIGAMFRYERPQAGRKRQFHQIGAEAIGSASPVLDFEMIAMCCEIFKEIGLEGYIVKINTLGCSSDKEKYNNALSESLGSKSGLLCKNCRERLGRNPLRVLDCKVESCKAVASSCPSIKERLCAACTDHHDKVKERLDEHNITFEDDPMLVRGLDYYTKTVFEIHHSALGARGAICGGGRYDGLVEELGGQSTPAVGFSIGMEATLEVLKKTTEVPEGKGIDVYVAYTGPDLLDTAAEMAFDLRKQGIATEFSYDKRSLKGQMKQANRLGAGYAVIVGEDELKENKVGVRNLRTEDADEKQKLVSLDDLSIFFKAERTETMDDEKKWDDTPKRDDYIPPEPWSKEVSYRCEICRVRYANHSWASIGGVDRVDYCDKCKEKAEKMIKEKQGG